MWSFQHHTSRTWACGTPSGIILSARLPAALTHNLPHVLLHDPHSKTRGMGAGRKLKIQRRENLWADKDYKKSHLGSEWKKPFAGCSHAKGIVLEKM